jgi:hypothetical protein
MKAGHELDALIAEKVMGLNGAAHDGPYLGDGPALEHYSTEIAAAWQVVEKMRGRNDIQGMPIKEISVTQTASQYHCIIESYGTFSGYADTAPLAICYAALKAVGYNVESTNQEVQP